MMHHTIWISTVMETASLNNIRMKDHQCKTQIQEPDTVTYPEPVHSSQNVAAYFLLILFIANFVFLFLPNVDITKHGFAMKRYIRQTSSLKWSKTQM
jgi:hypothetical protein